MRFIVLIWSFLLSFFSGGRTDIVSNVPEHGHGYSVCASTSTEKTADYTINREVCITAARGYSFAGNDSTNSVSLRITLSGKKTSPKVHSPFRMIKGGKVIDNNQSHPFLARPSFHLAGILIPERYIFSICRLRL